MNKVEINKEVSAKLLSILTVLESTPKSIEFRQPVDWKAFGLLDYPEIIKTPMDLGTIRSKLDSSKYSNVEEFQKDISLIWTNCKIYNRQGSEIYKQAEYMERVCNKQFAKLKEDLGIVDKSKKNKKKDESEEEEEEEEGVVFEEKVKLAEEVRRLNNECLTKFVKFIKEQCPGALEDLDAEKLQIKIDEIDKESFEKAKDLIAGFGKEVCKDD